MRVVYSTFPSREDAIDIGNELLKNRLIACFNVFKIESGYRWRGEIVSDEEWGVFFKTTDTAVRRVMQEIKKLHPYETPAVFSIVVEDVDEDYENWLENEVGVSDNPDT